MHRLYRKVPHEIFLCLLANMFFYNICSIISFFKPLFYTILDQLKKKSSILIDLEISDLKQLMFVIKIISQ